MDDTLTPERVPADALPAYARAVNRHFHEGEEPDDVAPYLDAFATDYRAWWVRHRGRVAANLGVIETDVSLPGGARLPVAAITAVGVAQTMRRRGLLTRLMDASLAEARKQGEPVAALFASESAIYGRYGFGVAADHRSYNVERARIRFRDPVDVRLVEETTPEGALAAWPAIQQRLGDERGGCVGNNAGMWQLNLAVDPPNWRDGATARRLVEVPGRGYATYRVKADEAGLLPTGEVRVAEVFATDPEAYAALWQHLLDIDLTARITTWIRPVDDALPHLVTDPLALHAAAGPPMYVRILDLPRVLDQRTYAAAGSATIEVVDPAGPVDGRWRLEVGEETVCEPTSADPDVTLPVDALASVVFGSVPPTALADARRLTEHRPGAARHLGRLLAVDRAPWSPVMF